jgi:hypothetical protein
VDFGLRIKREARTLSSFRNPKSAFRNSLLARLKSLPSLYTFSFFVIQFIAESEGRTSTPRATLLPAQGNQAQRPAKDFGQFNQPSFSSSIPAAKGQRLNT